ncbi:MAG: glycosyltransferase family 39 protein [Nitrosomonadales bacterium]|nr:glycosyltransferase family 39 protein [Nitrosomonadales bacterium]
MFYPQTKPWWILFLVAAASFIPTIGFYYVGEEAIFPIVSQEMWEQGTLLKQYLYGNDQMHNPLFNWLIMPFAALAGWEHVLAVARILTISFTLATALTLAWLVQRLYRDSSFAAFAAVGYLCMADLLLYHGWLSYVDPLFALFIFAAIATLWVGAHEKRLSLVVLSGVLITCAFLSKALTAYIFYGGALFVLLFESGQRRFLLNWRTLPVLAVTFGGMFIWYASIPGGAAQQQRMFAELTHKMDSPGLAEYATRLVSFPLEVLLWLAPLTLLALYLWLRKRYRKETEPLQRMLFLTACAIALLNFLPYWISPRGGMRYLMPLYPLFALVAARIVWQSGDAALALARKWIVGMLVLKFAVALVLFPYYQSHFRGQNYDETAADILTLTQGTPLYSMDVSSAGLSVTAYLNQRRLPATALQWPPANWSSGFVVARSADEAVGSVYKRYQLGGDELYLLCRGAACTRQ